MRAIFENFTRDLQANIAKEMGSVQEQIANDMKFDAFNPNPMISEQMKEQFFRDGYLIIPNAIPEKLRFGNFLRE